MDIVFRLQKLVVLGLEGKIFLQGNQVLWTWTRELEMALDSVCDC